MGNTKHKKLDDKETNYKEAIKKVEDNIHRIYDDEIIKAVMVDIGFRLRINSVEGTHFLRHILHAPFDIADRKKQAAFLI